VACSRRRRLDARHGKLLHQAGVRRKQALAVYTILVILFVLSLAPA